MKAGGSGAGSVAAGLGSGGTMLGGMKAGASGCAGSGGRIRLPGERGVCRTPAPAAAAG